MTKFLNISTDTTLGGSSASDSTVSSQKAIKAYVDSQTGTAPAFANITGQPTDNANLASALNAKYDASNPNGYTSNVGTVTSVNSVSPVNGNVTLSIPTVSDTYSATSSDAMSGKAVASAVSGYVPTSRTVNGKALSSNISLSASDIGALPDSTVIPTVNNATLTIQKNGTTVKTFTANASTDVTANITVPTKVSDLTNDSGFISGITSSDVTTALGYTPYNSSNPSGYQANVIETIKVNGTALTPSSKAVDITVPTVNNATLTITQGGTTKGTFTANASSNVTIDLDSGGGSVDVDNKSITTNSSDEIQTVGVINSRDSSTSIKTWTGTRAQYDAITTKDSATLYNITDDTTITQTILEALYPVGSVYITTANTCPLSALISGSTWELVSSGRVLQGADSGHSAGTTIEAGLPNITGKTNIYTVYQNSGYYPNEKSLYTTRGSTYGEGYYQQGNNEVINFDASRSSSIYGNSTTVQPPAYCVNIFRRTA